MKKEMRRFVLFITMLGCFMAWLAVLVFAIPKMLADPSAIDILMSFGLGTVTGFFILVLKDGWQFYFRTTGPPDEEQK